jgi:hypothetical protein
MGRLASRSAAAKRIALGSLLSSMEKRAWAAGGAGAVVGGGALGAGPLPFEQAARQRNVRMDLVRTKSSCEVAP